MSGTEIQPSRLSLGNKVSMITGAQYRYEGVVAAINSIEGTLTLQNVRFWGTENRVPGNGVTSNGESKPPAVGSMFDSITFWMSSIVQLWLLDDVKSERNDLGDKGVVKAGVPVDTGRGVRGRRQRGWWQSAGDPARPMRSSPTSGIPGVSNMSVPMGRYMGSAPNQSIISQPRMLVSYPRRGRNSAMLPRQASYVPVVPVVSGPGTMRRSTYGSNLRGAPFRLMHTPIPNGAPPSSVGAGPRGGGRKMMQSHRRMNGSVEDRHYHSGGLNTSGGVFVYLPPEMAAAYQSRGINLVPARPTMGRRRTTERRGTPRASSSIEPEIDCSTPYDFETANAELEAELAKITINPDGVPTVNTSGTSSTGDGVDSKPTTTSNASAALRSPSTGAGGIVCQAAANGNGASGDSSTGAVTSTVTTGSLAGSTNDTTTTALEGNGPLAKGEYYVRDKCFFDQISRSESGPRGPFAGNSRGVYSHSGQYGQSMSSGAGINPGYGGGSAAAARRERQLNMETFGPMAARAPFVPRRRPTGSVPREFLVSASA